MEDRIAPHRLAVFGAFHAEAGDELPPDTGTVFLLGPEEPGFWRHVTSDPEWLDGQPDPLDRWSARVIGAIARSFGGTACFPFGGPPYHPFYRWALRTGRAWASPVTLLVHDRAGLFASYRGAILLPQRIDLPPPPAAAPCADCLGQPCRGACPASALSAAGYDVPACHGFLDTEAGGECLSLGCAVRRACPVSQAYGRLPEQSAYHMRLFHT
ncbi:MAG: ferredoxin [Rhodobacterales bacterium 32-67-9]|nr:MAG: ferredoxin [Rhodobacterales bacterium 32-67-9]